MNYTELVTDGLHNRGYIVTTDKLLGVSGSECYCSLYTYSEDFKAYVDKTGSVSKYTGAHSASAVVFDFDGEREEFDDVREEVIKFVEMLVRGYDVPAESLYIAFSGNKGFHIAIPMVVIADVEMRSDFYKIYKDFVKTITERFVYADTGIYNPTRLMRILNTRHGESKLYKIPIGYQELLNKKLDIKKLAIDVRPSMDRLPVEEMERSKVLNSIWTAHTKLYNINEVEKDQKIAHDKTFTKALQQVAGTGGRHEALAKIAGYLIDKGVEYDEGFGLCALWDGNNNPPMGRERLHKDLTGLYKTFWDRRPDQKIIEEVSIEDIIVYGSGYTEQYDQHIARIAQFGRMKLGYPVIDEPTRGMIAGEVAVIVGKSSIGKSALAQNIAINNVDEGRRVLFFSLEMPIATVAERNLQMMLRKSGRRIEREKMEGNPFLDEDIANANAKLERLVTVPVQGIHYPLIEKYVYQTEDFFGEKIDLIIIDYAGLIKFEGGTLYEQQSGIAKDLKALSGRTSTGIITLAQVSKQYKDGDELDLDSTRDSGVVVEASDYVYGLWRAMRDGGDSVAITGSVIKNRNGSKVDFSADLHKQSLRYTIYNRIREGEEHPDYTEAF